MRLAGLLCVVGAAGLLLVGCEHRFFVVEGVVQSDGGGLGRWASAPEGCSRGEIAGSDAGHTDEVVTFAWQDPRLRMRLRGRKQPSRVEAPLELRVMGVGERTRASLALVGGGGAGMGPVLLDASMCRELVLTTREGKASLPEGRATLGGTLVLDCSVKSADGAASRVQARLQFNGCEY